MPLCLQNQDIINGVIQGIIIPTIPKQLSWLYGTIRHQEQGNPSDVKFGSIEKRKKIQSIKMTKYSNSIICSTNEPNLRFLYSLFKLSLYNCDGNKYYCIVLYIFHRFILRSSYSLFFSFINDQLNSSTSPIESQVSILEEFLKNFAIV